MSLQECITGWQAGDREAANTLLIATQTRLQKLAQKMIRTFPNVRGEADTADVLQNAVLRLLHSLRKMKPATTRMFFSLAAIHIRRELLDLARSCKGKRWVSLDTSDDSDSPITPHEEPRAFTPTAEFELWVRFHEAVDQLPTELRETVGLVFYHGWEHQEIADLFKVSVRTVGRRWAEACKILRERVGRELTDNTK
jgi:RNA polymerase sigma-70 factor (ECF subfamily)